MGLVTKSTLKNNEKLNIFSFYFSPTTRINPDVFEFINNNFKNNVLLGDVNAKNTMWHCPKNDPKGEILENLLNEHNLHILNSDGVTYERGKSVLDLSICSNSVRNKFVSHQILDIKISDHLPTITTFNDINREPKKCTFKKINWPKFNKIISTACLNEPNLNCPEGLDIELNSITNTITTAIEESSETITFISKALNPKPVPNLIEI